ncbi:hypothetical protein CBOM_06626 [Ceraceosorus bombacis]|uniref:Uncharacterized protein n=1 Tax=Ceraceosorus bombacis TaxID=401625 RepID=A0A0P1A3C9_9BASI|nr:hypothetical protein CBOM_06626 [Ceraceosorus bombacis]
MPRKKPRETPPTRQRAPTKTKGQLPATKRRRFGPTDTSSLLRVAAAGSSTSSLLPSLPIMATSSGASASTATVAPSAGQPPPLPAHQAGLSADLLPSSPIVAMSSEQQHLLLCQQGRPGLQVCDWG